VPHPSAIDGADVVTAQGISQCPLELKPQWLMAELGVPVVEGIGADQDGCFAGAARAHAESRALAEGGRATAVKANPCAETRSRPNRAR
jgi:hypothetical protein